MPLRDPPTLDALVARFRRELARRPHEPLWFVERDELEMLLAAAEWVLAVERPEVAG
jgi:hypothetical protein